MTYVDRIRALAADGLSQSAIARTMKRSSRAISDVLKRHGITATPGVPGRPRLKDPKVCRLRITVNKVEYNRILRLQAASGAPSVSELIFYLLQCAADEWNIAPTAGGGEKPSPWAWDGSRLKTVRIARGWSQATLAARVGISVTTICQLECGRHFSRPATRSAIAHALRCAESDLFPAELA